MKRLLLVLVILAISPAADAYHIVSSFSESANIGGGSSLFYTGSSRFKGYDCSICHVDAEGRISIELETPLLSGRYTPGLIYPITVRLVGEHRGLDSAFNPNTFTADFTDADGNPVGFPAGGASQVLIESDRSVAVAEGLGEGETEWTFSWWAPNEGVPATLHIAMLDGDGAGLVDRRFIDPLNDDVATLKLQLCPEGEVCDGQSDDTIDVAPMGCAVADSSGMQMVWMLLIGLIAIRRRQTP